MSNPRETNGEVNPAIKASLLNSDSANLEIGDMVDPEFAEKQIRYGATTGSKWKGNVHDWGSESEQ